MLLEDKIAVVTGAGRGIGKATALAMARQGADIVLADKTPDTIAHVAREIEAMGRRALGIKADMGYVDQIKAMIDEAASVFGRIDILVNNAGIDRIESTLELTEKSWDDIMAVNLKGYFFCAQQVALLMKKGNGGKIVNISSVDAKYCLADHAHYSASKAGVSQLTRNLALDFAKWGINVNGIAPSWVLTDLTREGWEKEKDYWLPRIPAGRIGMPEDVADVAVFLASDSSRFLYGAIIVVDGGITLNL